MPASQDWRHPRPFDPYNCPRWQVYLEHSVLFGALDEWRLLLGVKDEGLSDRTRATSANPSLYGAARLGLGSCRLALHIEGEVSLATDCSHFR